MDKRLIGSLIIPFLYVPSVLAEPMKNLGSLSVDNYGDTTAYAISADGTTIVGASYNGLKQDHAFRWTSAGLQDLENAKPGYQDYSTAKLVNAEGSVIAGEAITPVSGGAVIARGFRWTKVDGQKEYLGSLGGNGSSTVKGMSADGSVIVGSASKDKDIQHAYRWTDGPGMKDLGTLGTGNSLVSGANAVSADGSTVVGFSGNDNNETRAFRWIDTPTGMEDLGTLKKLNSGNSTASGVNVDGSIIIGDADNDSGETRAFRWTKLKGMEDLGTLKADNSGSSHAKLISADGSTIIGSADSDNNQSNLFRWTETSKRMQSLGTLNASNSGPSTAAGVSADGKSVVGTSRNDNNQNRAFLWTEALGRMQDLGTLKSDNSGVSSAVGISADGKVIAGNSDTDEGRTRAFIYKVSSGGMQDYENILKSFPKLAAERELAAAQQQFAMSRLLDTNCFVGETGANCLALTGVLSNTSADGNYIGRRERAQGIVTLGHGFTELLTFGVNVSVGGTRLRDSSIDSDAAYGVSGWGEYSETGLAHEGLQANAALGYNTQNTTLSRGKGLANVQTVKGSTDLDTIAGRIGVGYGLKLDSDWLLTPEVALIRQQTTFDSYKEKRGGFVASYKQSHLKSTVLEAGLTGQRALDSISRIEVGAGVEQDLSVERMRMKGSFELSTDPFDIKSPLSRNSLRPYMKSAYTYDFNKAASLSAGILVARDTFSNSPEVSVSASYGLKF